MRRLPICLLAASLLLSVPGCTEAPPPTQAAQPSTKPAEATEMRDTIQQPIDKARATEEATLNAAEDQRKQIEAAGG